MPDRISKNDLSMITRRVDRNGNNLIDSSEARVSGRVGNNNGSNGVQETADAIEKGQATLSNLSTTGADGVADVLSHGDAWVSKEDVFISDSARQRIDGQAGGAVDNKISKKELSAALQRGDVALTGDGILLSSEVSSHYRPTPPSVNPSNSSNSNRPTPPSVNPNNSSNSNRPTPPSVNPSNSSNSNRPTPPSVNPSNSDRPTPPSVDPTNEPPHVPRYYWQPEYPIILQSNPQELPKIERKPAPAPARKVGMEEVSNDVVELLAEKDRLRTVKKTLMITTHPELTTAQAKDMLKSGKTIYLAEDGGSHLSKDAYKPITKQSQLDPMLPELRDQKLGELQANENRAYDNRVQAWNNEDINARQIRLPEFNSIYNMERLNLSNYMVSAGGRSFNRNIMTAMNVYRQDDVRREIATRWHNDPDMTTEDFNHMASQVICNHVADLASTANYQSEWSIQQSPIPGLRYPDTQDDIDYNADIIRQTAMELPMLLSAAVQH
ncbi:MAG: hypothetical protein ACM3YO_06620 [Bacteroidota bacterium]